MKRGDILTTVSKFFKVVISTDVMQAKLYCTEHYHEVRTLDKMDIIQYLNENKIIYGIDNTQVELLTSPLKTSRFPLIIAKGFHPVNGKDGTITYMFNASSEVKKNSEWNFRDVMRIPTVKINEKLATITPPTQGIPGTNIVGTHLFARKGKPNQTKAGKNVRFNEENDAFYADKQGQISIRPNALEIHNVFYIDETLSMKKGNIDFIGSVIIKGDVPTGFTVTAGGDIKMFGLVEAATIHAKGSLYINEGFSGMQKGFITAGHDIHLGYMNQGRAYADGSIYVENSILHSTETNILSTW